ncbi:hypothetical protein QYM36_004235 [Artemia franciscana]|uniref:DUF4371 domain-containing protein n=1 Tax=Artemia franciscana TaxID=6661 RepID=A0AA88LG31_ARTSF|nr:hypothetical protein QYM36_004235 [Artemia franciscana]
MDVTGVEQLSLNVRYFESTTKCIRVNFLGFAPSNGPNVQNITSTIKEKVFEWGLDLSDAVGQGYDGCSTMAGRISGVHKKFLMNFPWPGISTVPAIT